MISKSAYGGWNGPFTTVITTPNKAAVISFLTSKARLLPRQTEIFNDCYIRLVAVDVLTGGETDDESPRCGWLPFG